MDKSNTIKPFCDFFKKDKQRGFRITKIKQFWVQLFKRKQLYDLTFDLAPNHNSISFK